MTSLQVAIDDRNHLCELLEEAVNGEVDKLQQLGEVNINTHKDVQVRLIHLYIKSQ